MHTGTAKNTGCTGRPTRVACTGTYAEVVARAVRQEKKAREAWKQGKTASVHETQRICEHTARTNYKLGHRITYVQHQQQTIRNKANEKTGFIESHKPL